MRSNADFQVGGLFPVLLPQGLGGATAPEMRWVAVLLCGHCELPSLRKKTVGAKAVGSAQWDDARA